MIELISIDQRKLNGAIIQTANARDLHGFLESKQDFSTWIKARIAQYGFVEGADYLLHKFMEQMPSGAKSKTEYHLTLDMAKELSMVERSAKGKEARQYFLECERKAKAEVDPVVMLNDPATMRNLLLGYSERVLALEGQNNAMRPKVEALDRIATADGSMCVTDAAKLLQMRPKDLFDWLHRHKWTHRRRGRSGWIAYQERLQNGFLEHKVTTVERSDGTEKIVEQVRILPKGLAKLAESVARA